MTELALHRGRGRTGATARLGQWMISVICLIAPAILNRSPLVYPDTRAYYLGGRTAVEKFLSVLHPATGGGAGGDALAATIQKARGVRSAFYSLFTYLPAVSVSLWLVILLQAVIVTALLRLVFRLIVPNQGGWASTIFIALLSLATTLSWVSSVVMPDIFTPIMALAISTLVVYWDRLTNRTVAAVWCAIAGSMVMHITNLPIALGLTVISLTTVRPIFSRRYLVLGCAFVWAIIGMLAVSVVGFHQVTLTPQAPPFLLSRSLSDGTGRLYLQSHCPEIGLDMCKHLDKLDQSAEKFMWDKEDGVYSAVSPDEEAAIRSESNRIFIAATLDHPWMEAKAMATNAGAQLISFGYHEYYIPSWADFSPTDLRLHLPGQADWQKWASDWGVLVVLVSIAMILRSLRLDASLTRYEIRFVVLIVSTVLFEALIGAISEPAPRYEARVIWLLPMLGLMLTMRRSRRNVTLEGHR